MEESAPTIEQRISFFCDLEESEKQNIRALATHANKMIFDYFNRNCEFDIIICEGAWCMEVQTISRRKSNESLSFNDTAFSLTDVRLKEIVVRKDKAKFGHYLHEMIHSVIRRGFPEQLREALAWYFTMELTESSIYVRPNYSSWVGDLYLEPIGVFAAIFGKDFVKEFALGNAEIEDSALPEDVYALFLPEEFYHSKKFVRH